MVIAGYSTGGVNFFDGKNGTVLGSAGGSNAVAAVVRSGQVIAHHRERRDIDTVGISVMLRLCVRCSWCRAAALRENVKITCLFLHAEWNHRWMRIRALS